MFCSLIGYGQITYVNHAATGANNGTSWANAYTSLRLAINVTTSGEIWVAQGTYYPATVANPNRSLSFTLKNNVAIYGGFVGTETARSQRDYENNETIMSGDIGVAGDNTDNTYHVIKVSGSSTAINSSAKLDGFTIKDGNAESNDGGGAAFSSNCNPLISNCTFIDNRGHKGGAISCTSSTPTFTNVSFIDNDCQLFGGAFYSTSHGITFSNCYFEGNYSPIEGGALYFLDLSGLNTTIIDSCTFLIIWLYIVVVEFRVMVILPSNSTFEDNQATSQDINSGSYGGALYCDGNFNIINSIFTGNKSYLYGGAIVNAANLNIYNSVFHSNKVFIFSGSTYNGNNSGGIVNGAGQVTIKNSILYNNSTILGLFGGGVSNYYDSNGGTSTIDYCIGQGLPSSPNNFDTNPLFVSNTSYRLQFTSPAINAGDNSAIPSGITTDIGGNNRIFGGTVDIGAYEFEACNYVANNRIYVDVNKTSGLNDGLTWNNAFQDLQDALAFAQSCEAVQEIWVADGTYYPTSGTDRTIAFELKNGLKIYGGFAGNETSLSQRNFRTNISILSGEIGSTGSTSDNSYHVVTSIGNDNTAILDGFTITKGAANLNSNDNNYGAGLYGDGTSAIIQNCTFTGNAATFGAGVYQKNAGNSTFTNCIFHANTTVGLGSGGGAYIRDATSSFTNCLFYKNNGFNGGGIYNFNTQITITNSTFADNSGLHGGGIYSNDTIAQRYTVTNCIFWNNSALTQINRTTFNVTYSIVQGGYTGTGNLNQDPLFVDAANDNYALQASSPAVDAGNNAAIPSGITTDLAGFDRIINGTVNMGAFETSNSVLPVELLYFKGQCC
ncbi:MAG: hypothetical protein HC803_11335 [Saprospiraceae bacterium]|nr:hypothetical protein [Saprospiraceae bacterium]